MFVPSQPWTGSWNSHSGERTARWVSVATFAAGLDADIAVQQLEAAGIPAIARGNDIVGLFGPGFTGPSARGVEVVVPSPFADEARSLLEPGDDAETDEPNR